ncbi:AbrB family transcriptional regulator [Dendrosporobacter sp. 1207_IL3150]|uniref:AbrB family transcriptional regulator n=1 Tax=Dendrosporobacter sp. 1207_IL3150 TaxID=3084054 RepID=UPI002FDB7ADA
MRNIFETFLIAVSGALIFNYLHIPLPWMLGSLTAVGAYKIVMAKSLKCPRKLRNTSLVILGYAIGRPFSQDAGLKIIEQLPLMVLVTTITIAASLFIGYIMHKKTGISLASGLLGSVPGGLSQMVVLAEEIAGSSVTIVTFIQTVRLLTVIFTVPFLATHGLAGTENLHNQIVQPQLSGESTEVVSALMFFLIVVVSALGAKYAKLPTPYLLGPILATGFTIIITGIEAPALPSAVIIAAQIVFGVYLGTSINISSISNYPLLLPYAVCGSLAIVSTALAAGYLLNFLGRMPLITGFLSTAPGGMAEMGLTAMQLHADISIIVAYQLFRLLVILIIVPLLLKKFLKNVSL